MLLTGRVARSLSLLLCLLFLSALPAAGQDGEHRAALVVRFSDGSTQTRCVAFPEASITGEQLLARSGFQAIVNPTAAYGGAVCSINGSGCNYPSQDCFCRCMGTQCEYWAYYHWAAGAAGGSWQYSQVGATGYEVRDGALDGWSWGPGNFSSATEPPRVSFAEICREGAAVAPKGAGASPANLAQYAGFAAAAVLLLLAAAVVWRRTKSV